MLSEQSNYVSDNAVRQIYFGLARLIVLQLRKKELLRLPGIGDFALIEQKARPAWVGRKQVRIAARKVLKFYPAEHMKRYFSEWQGPHSIADSNMYRNWGNYFDFPEYRE